MPVRIFTHTQQTLYKSFLKFALFFIFFLSAFFFSPFVSQAQATVSFNSWVDFDNALNAETGTDGPVITTYQGNKTSSTAFDYFSDTPSVDDTITFAAPRKFKDIKFYVGTSMNGTPTFTWEYSKGNSTWGTLKVENGNAITKSGEQTVRFSPPNDWTGLTTNSRPAFSIRIRLTGVTGVTEGGAQSTQKVQKGDLGYTVTGTSQNTTGIETYDEAQTYTLLSATTPATGLVPIEMPTNILESVDKVDVILSSTTAGAGDTVVLTGVDLYGNSQTETIDVSGGNGTYTSVKSFKNITQVDANGFSDGTISVNQKHLHFMEKRDSQFRFAAYVFIGDAIGTTTTFTTSNEQWYFYPGFSFNVRGANTTFTSGAVDTTGKVKFAYSGSDFFFANMAIGSGANPYAPWQRLFSTGTTGYLYNTILNYQGGASDLYFAEGSNLTIVDSAIIGSNFRLTGGGTWSVDGLYSQAMYGERFSPTFSLANNIKVNSAVSMINNRASFTFQNSNFETFTNFNNLDANRYVKFIDSNVTTSDISGGTNNNAGDGIYLQYTFKLKVIDTSGNAISGAAVVITDYQGTQVASLTTNASGDITDQTLDQYKGLWTYPGSGITWQQRTPHTVIISKSGYETRTIKYTMDRKREEIEVLKAAPAGYVTSPQSGTGTVKVLGTEYGGSESGVLYAQVQNQDGTPANGATVTLTVYKSDGTAWVSSQSMTYITGSNGIYKYTFTSPTDVGVYVADVSSTSPTAYGTGEFHVSQWAQNIATSSAQIAGLPSASDIWAYSSRSLSSFGSLVSDIWANSTRSLTTFGTLIADIWSYTTRTLTESALSAADVWNYATRTLTGASLSSGQLATKTNVDEATSSAVLSIKTSNDYNLGDIIGYVDTLETSVGTSSDTSSQATLFGRIKKVQDQVDQLTTIDTNIDTLVSKWGSYSASDIYDKVKNLSSDISAINTVSNVSSILSLAQTNETNVKEVKNKVLAMKAVVDVNRILLENVSNQPIIKTWLEEGSIIFKTLITNPSAITSQTVPLKYYLPRELKKEDIIKIDEELKVDYDTSQEAYFVSGEFDLGPKETKIITVEVKDIWKISDDEVNSLRKQAAELSKPLKGTSYFAQGTLVKSDIDVSLDKILRIQKDATTPQGRIRAYREAKAEMQIVAGKMDTMKTLVASAGSTGTMFGFIGGVQTLGVWGLVIVLIAGFVFLALYIRMLSLQQHNHLDRGHGIKTAAVIDFWAPIRPLINKKVVKIVIIAFLAAGLAMFILNFLTTRMNQNKLPAGINAPKQESSAAPTLTPSTQPKKDTSENEEIQVTDEKQVLGTATSGKIKVIVPDNDAVNIRKEPSLESEVVGKFWLTREVAKISEKEDWVKIKVSIEKEGVKYSEGWVNKKFIEEL